MASRLLVLHDLLDRAAERWPDRPAVTSGEETLSYGELDQASRRLACWLHETGLRRGQRLLTAVPGSVPLTALIFAASRAGVVFSVVHEQVRGARLEHMLDDCEPALLVTDVPAAAAAAHIRGVRVVETATLRARASGQEQACWVPPAVPLAVDPICMVYTSGSTALPKAVVGTHQQVVFAARAIQEVLRYRAEDVIYSPLPLSFDYGLYQLFLAALSGARLSLGRPAEAGPPLLANLIRSGATILPAVPTVADALARLLRRPGAGRPGLRMLTNTGAAMPQQTLRALRQALPGLRVHLMFGLTECKRATIMIEDGDLSRPGSCGIALPGTEVLIVDEAGRPRPAGEIGEIVVRGPHVMAGYWRRAELTAQRFHRAEGLFPELRTGDYGWLDEAGYLYFVGRRDDIYKENGFRVSATEVEAAARRVPGVEAAAVLPPTASRPSLLFVAGAITPAEVLCGLREQIEEYKIPGRCLVLDELPLTGNGKVDRRALEAEEADDARVG